MAELQADGYQSWYQAKLWQLLPAVYRNQDATSDGVAGPLQELFNRIGAQSATLRRSIDRLWENQSIETCDDWVIPYIGDLLATRLVSCLDARAQRVDVAKTIYYRRRAGTLGLLEELVADIAGRDARAVEFFRRLGRTRHQFDPPIGNVFAADATSWTGDTTYAVGDIVANGVNVYVCVAGGISEAGGGPIGDGTAISDGGVEWDFYNPLGALVPAVIEGLAGLNSRTPAGGFADLRNNYAAANTGTAFDEFAHTADLRAGAQSFGWDNISHLGMFIWWRHSYPIQGATPVADGPVKAGEKSPCFTFDPSGRKMQLFAPSSRIGPSGTAGFGADWVALNEWQLPVAVREVFWQSWPGRLYGPAFSVALGAGGAPAAVPYEQLRIHPETGQFSFTADPPIGTILSNYCFGLMSTIGAGGFALDILQSIALPAAVIKVTGDGGLENHTGIIAADTTVEIQSSITYTGITADLKVGDHTFALTALAGQRPMIRWAAGGATWTIEGAGGNLIIQGIWLQGADLVLTGTFESVTLGFVTLDPGSLDSAGKVDHAIDGLVLAPVRLRVQARIGTLTLDHCITGPIATEANGAIEQLNANDSIIQAIDTEGAKPDLALHTIVGDISLVRCTVLGPCQIHKMDASECIFDQAAVAEDEQHGCVRFCAIAAGSKLHAPYQSVAVPALGPLFRSRRFGAADYARLPRLADQAIVDPQTGDTILGGAQNGSEIGAFQSESVTLQKRGLVLKFEEYAPLGVFPVWIEAD